MASLAERLVARLAQHLVVSLIAPQLHELAPKDAIARRKAEDARQGRGIVKPLLRMGCTRA